MGYDLFIQAPRGTLLPPSEGIKLLEAFREETDLDGPCEITEHATPLPAHASDVRTVNECIREGECSLEEYQRFCSALGVRPGAGNEAEYEAARSFLDYNWGQTQFSLELPREEDEGREAYRLIIEFARRHKLVVHDPQIGEAIDLDKPGEFPPMWGPRPAPKAPKRRWFHWW